MASDGVLRQAEVSSCGRYRWTLTRVWEPDLPRVAFVGLNPSTADGRLDDATIRVCTGFARRWGYGALVMLNLFAWRATDPGKLPVGVMAVGDQNDLALAIGSAAVREHGGIVVCCWGAHPAASARRDRALRLVGSPVHCLGLTQSGAPRHPLRLPVGTRPQVWREASGA